jgi:hypothetical protein
MCISSELPALCGKTGSVAGKRSQVVRVMLDIPVIRPEVN